MGTYHPNDKSTYNLLRGARGLISKAMFGVTSTLNLQVGYTGGSWLASRHDTYILFLILQEPPKPHSSCSGPSLTRFSVGSESVVRCRVKIPNRLLA